MIYQSKTNQIIKIIRILKLGRVILLFVFLLLDTHFNSYGQLSNYYKVVSQYFPTVVKLPGEINSKFDEFSPVVDFKENILYFSRIKSRDVDKKVKFFEEFSHIYYVHKINGKWSDPVELESFNLPRDNNIVCGISKSFDRIFFFSFVDGGDIFCSDKTNGQWSIPKRLGKNINMTQFMESDISINSKNDEIYFSRIDIKNNGDYNIYETSRVNGKWEYEIKLDSNINTVRHERAPFIDSSGRYLFFSSSGHNSLGGYDIFVSIIKNGCYSKPINLGYPINTINDDCFFSISNDLKYAYYSSNQSEDESSDIYEVDFSTINLESYLDWNAQINRIDSILKINKDSSLLLVRGIYNINNGDYYNGFSDIIQLRKIEGNPSKTTNPFCSDEDLYDYFNKVAVDQFQKNDYQLAIKSFSNMLVIKANDTTAMYNRSIANYYNKEIGNSWEDINLAIRMGSHQAMKFKDKYLDDQSVASYFNKKAIQYYKEDKFDLAINNINKVIEIIPNSIVALKIRAEIKQKSGDKEGACKDCLEAFKLGDTVCKDLINENCK